MSLPTEKLIKDLKKVAQNMAQEKSPLFVALVHAEGAPHDRWDLLVSSQKLEPWSIESIKYIVGKLRQAKLTAEEMVRIAQVVALPLENALVKSLRINGQLQNSTLAKLHPMDRPDDAIVIWDDLMAHKVVGPRND